LIDLAFLSLLDAFNPQWLLLILPAMM